MYDLVPWTTSIARVYLDSRLIWIAGLDGTNAVEIQFAKVHTFPLGGGLEF